MTDTPKEARPGPDSPDYQGTPIWAVLRFGQLHDERQALTEDVARMNALASEATYTVSNAQSVIDICALALNHAQSHEGRVVGQVMAVLDMLSDHLETKLEGDLTKLELGMGKIARILKEPVGE